LFMKKILIILLIVIVLGFGVFFYFNKNNSNNVSDNNETEDSLEIIESGQEPEKEQKIEEYKQVESVLLNVPFVVQAPLANWDNPIFQDACEEAAILMAKYWLLGKDISSQQAYNEILKLAEFEQEKYGNYFDHSAEDVVQIIKDYIDYQEVYFKKDIDINDIKTELARGNLVVVPINGQAISNPYYSPPGPERHMLVIIGYNNKTKQFITNDSGTKNGKNYCYNQDVLFWSIRDYPTGHKIPIVRTEKAMIIVKSN